VREKLSNEETGEIYGKRKIDVEPVFGFLKANLGFTRMYVRGKPKVHNEMGFALMGHLYKKHEKRRLHLSFIDKHNRFCLFEASYFPSL